METKLITYNLKERGRKYRGVDRNFNVKAICDAINSPACQERVKHGDMVGFYGHWPRVKFGMNPAEGGIADGKAQTVEPALVTTHLKAFSDGTIEHKERFLGTNAGQLAFKLYQEKAGGFSSAIDPVKPEFYGFDWVLEPNYSTNRGYALDSIAVLDDVLMAEYNDQIAGVMELLRLKEHNYMLALQTLGSLQSENAELISQLANKNAVLDSVDKFERPLILNTSRKTQIERDVAAFRSAKLPRFSTSDSNPEMERYLEFQQRLR